MKTNNKVGPPVEGTDFFGRAKEIRDTWSEIVECNNLLISAPRRIGKSSLAKKLVAIAIENGWKGSYVDVQDIDSEIGFYKSFVATLKKDTSSWISKTKESVLSNLSDLFSRIELSAENEAGAIKLKWNSKEMSDVREKIVELLREAGDLLVAVDELPFFLARLEKAEDGPKRVSDFLSFLRALRHKDLSSVRWIFCGSIGLDHFTSKLKLTGVLNDLNTYPLSAFDIPTAIAFLKQLGTDYQLNVDDSVATKIIDKLGWPLPYFLQAHFRQLRRIKADDLNSTITEDQIELAYQNLIQQNLSLKTWEERLDDQFDEMEAKRCKILLTGLCKSKKGLKRKKLFELIYDTYEQDSSKCDDGLGRLLVILENDGYLIMENGNYGFRSPLLRDYWYSIKVR